MEGILEFEAVGIDGRPRRLSSYAGRVLLVVNVASRCGFTPQYKGLEELQRRYHDRGFDVLGFPCNQFGGQEPGTDAEVATFCETGFGVTFPMFSKIEVNGPGAHPLYRYLRSASPGILGTEAIKWNFTKFLVGRDGMPVRRYSPTVTPEDIAADIERQLEIPARG